MRHFFKFVIITIIISLIIPNVTGSDQESEMNADYENQNPNSRTRALTEIGTISKNLTIAPGENFYAYLDYKNQTVVELEITDPTENLPQQAKDALDAVPSWLHDDLEYTFTTLTTSEATTYANYILNAEDPEYVDEIAFCIAYSHQGLLSWMISNGHDGLFAENAKYIYNVSNRGLNYVQIVEKSDYTTLSYNSSFSGTQELDRDIYYEHVVYPRTHIELPMYYTVDSTSKFWRPFFLEDARWGKSVYDAVKDATTMYNAVEELGDWIVNFMEFQYGFNYIQPIDVYLHRTQCSCGQYTIITGAMAKAALIPCTSLGTRSEDHIWNEFYDTKWIHWDTSIGDINFELNMVDKPGVYDPDPPEDQGGASGALGKEVSTVYIMNSDESIEQSLLYTPYGSLTINVKDKNSDPVDGAKIFLYPATVNNNPNRGVCIWGYTDSAGQVRFDIGNKLDYYVRSSHPQLGDLPGGTQVWLCVQNAQNGNSYNFNIQYTNDDVAGLNTTLKTSTTSGTVKITSEFVVEHERQWGENEETIAYGLGVKYPIDDYGQSLSFFICDAANFKKYEAGTNFDAYEVTKRVPNGDILFETDEQREWYAVISNDHAYATTKTVNFTMAFYFEGKPDVKITSPANGTKIAIDDIVSVTGTVFSFNPVSTVEINVDNSGWMSVSDTSGGTWSTWKYDWDTTGSTPGIYELEVKATDTSSKFATHKIKVILEDLTAPALAITEPADNSEFNLGTIITIGGTASDNVAIRTIEIIVDGDEDNVTNITSNYSSGAWSYDLDTDGFVDGGHAISARTFDTSANFAISTINITLLEITAPLVTISSPLNNSIFEADEIIAITGTATDNKAVTQLDLLIDSNSPIDITPNLNPDGSWAYLWDPSITSTEDGTHTIKVEAFDAVLNFGFAEIQFIIDGTPPEVSITEPMGETIISAGDEIHLGGEYSDNILVVEFEIYYDDEKYVNMTVNSDHSNWVHGRFLTDDLESGELKITVRVIDLVGLVGEDSIIITVDAEDPVVEIQEISGPVMDGEIVTIKGSASDDLEVVNIRYGFGSGQPYDITSEYNNGLWQFEFNTTTKKEGIHTITVRVFDIVDKQATDEILIEIISKTTDTDEDGLPDWWELEFELNRYIADSHKDRDRDDFTNLEEYLGEDGEPGNDDYSDPTDKNSVPYTQESDPETDPGSESTSLGENNLLWFILIIIVVIVILIVLFLMLKRKRAKSEDEIDQAPEPAPEVPEQPLPPILPPPPLGFQPLPVPPPPKEGEMGEAQPIPPPMLIPPPGMMMPPLPPPQVEQPEQPQPQVEQPQEQQLPIEHIEEQPLQPQVEAQEIPQAVEQQPVPKIKNPQE